MNKKHRTYTEPRIPVQLTEVQFNEFILRHLPIRKRGPRYKISDFKICNYSYSKNKPYDLIVSSIVNFAS